MSVWFDMVRMLQYVIPVYWSLSGFTLLAEEEVHLWPHSDLSDDVDIIIQCFGSTGHCPTC